MRRRVYSQVPTHKTYTMPPKKEPIIPVERIRRIERPPSLVDIKLKTTVRILEDNPNEKPKSLVRYQAPRVRTKFRQQKTDFFNKLERERRSSRISGVEQNQVEDFKLLFLEVYRGILILNYE